MIECVGKQFVRCPRVLVTVNNITPPDEYNYFKLSRRDFETIRLKAQNVREHIEKSIDFFFFALLLFREVVDGLAHIELMCSFSLFRRTLVNVRRECLKYWY